MNILCVISTSGAFRNVRTLAQSAALCLDFDKVFFIAKEAYIAGKWDKKIAQFVDAPVRGIQVSSGSDVLKALADAADETDERVHVCFDDAFIVAPLGDDDAGFLYSEHAAVCIEESRDRMVNDLYSIPCDPIRRRLDLASLRGSFFSFRAGSLAGMKADVSLPDIDLFVVRVAAWHAMKNAGVGHVQSITHVRQAKTATEDKEKRAIQSRWFDLCKDLEQSTGDRYWQNWDADERVQRVEKFWKDDRQQVARRNQLYEILTDVEKKVPGETLLDAGCGVCFDKDEIEKIGFEYHGSDVTPAMLERAKERHPDARVHLDDMLDSGFEDRQWPVVLCSAVIPHLPPEHHQRAIDTLWRIAGKCLIVRFFGVDMRERDETTTLRGFLYSQFRDQTWRNMFQRLGPAPSSVQYFRGRGDTKDILIAVAWR